MTSSAPIQSLNRFQAKPPLLQDNVTIRQIGLHQSTLLGHGYKHKPTYASLRCSTHAKTSSHVNVLLLPYNTLTHAASGHDASRPPTLHRIRSYLLRPTPYAATPVLGGLQQNTSRQSGNIQDQHYVGLTHRYPALPSNPLATTCSTPTHPAISHLYYLSILRAPLLSVACEVCSPSP